MKKLLISSLTFGAVFFIFSMGCEPDEPYPPPNIDHNFGEMTDLRDGQKYQTIEIGNQSWMAENLKYLPSVSPSSGGSYTEPYYYVYGYEGTNVNGAKATDNFNTYGALYNWPAALTACPPGWHLPSDADWTTLTDYLGGESVAGGKMKSTGSIDAGTGLWYAPNTDATNESGWSGLPGGYRDGNFYNLCSAGYWWSSSERGADNAWDRDMYYRYGGVGRRNYNKDYGFSVRCLRE